MQKAAADDALQKKLQARAAARKAKAEARAGTEESRGEAVKPQVEFKLGQYVKCRQRGDEWVYGEVTCINPLKVTLSITLCR